MKISECNVIAIKSSLTHNVLYKQVTITNRGHKSIWLKTNLSNPITHRRK